MAIALVLLSIGAVVGFNMILGAPWGYFLTAGIYALVAVAAGAGAKTGAKKQRDEARDHVEESRRTVREVMAPMRHPTHYVPARSGPREAGLAEAGLLPSGRPVNGRQISATTFQE